MKFELRPARRGNLYTRMLLYGESGQGKTFTALEVAFHLADLYGIAPNKIAVGDTETVESADREDGGTGSAEKYEGRPCNCNRCHRQGLVLSGFQTMILEAGHRDPDSFMRFLEVCKKDGIMIVILDGITDEWRSLLQLVDQIKAQSRGREDGWGTARPLHNKFVQAVMEYPGHVIVTCRAKKESRHKKAEDGPGDVLPDQDSNVIYEYDVSVLVRRGTSYVVKTRDDRLENFSSRHAGADMAESLKRWCDDPRAQDKSAVGAHLHGAAPGTAPGEEGEPSNRKSLPSTAPNTRTDVVNAMIAQAEGNMEVLIGLGRQDVADQSRTYLNLPQNRVPAALRKLVERQEAVIDEERAVAAEEAERAREEERRAAEDRMRARAAEEAEQLRRGAEAVPDPEPAAMEGFDLPF